MSPAHVLFIFIYAHVGSPAYPPLRECILPVYPMASNSTSPLVFIQHFFVSKQCSHIYVRSIKMTL